MPRTDFDHEPMSVQFRATLPPDLHAALKAHARAQDRSMAAVMRRAIEAHLAREPVLDAEASD